MKKDYRILVVDDSGFSREVVADMLAEQGYIVETACGGNEALHKCPDFQPHLLLVDVVMPRMSGIELIEELRVKENPYEVIIVTGRESLADATRAMELGAFAYLTKPVTPDDLRNQVEKALQVVKDKEVKRKHLAYLEEQIVGRTKELASSERMLENQGQRLDVIVNSMEEGMLAVDTQDCVMMMNRRSEDILQVKSPECVGRDLRQVLRDTQVGDELGSVLSVQGEGTRLSRMVALRQADGSVSSFLVNVAQVKDTEGNRIGRIITFADQSDRLRAENLRDMFLSIVSHELRTPLTVIGNNLGILMLQGVDVAVRDEAMGDMKSAVERMIYLVGNVIAIARLSDASAFAQRSATDIHSLVRDQIVKFKRQVSDKDVRVEVRADWKNAVVDTDYRLLATALGCLLSNAIEFSRQGGLVTVGIGRTTFSGETYLLLSIVDRGIGMSQQVRGALFREFTQGEPALTRTHTGMGVGLFLAKRAVDLLNGRIDVSSIEGEGSRFTIRIPVEETADS